MHDRKHDAVADIAAQMALGGEATRHTSSRSVGARVAAGELTEGEIQTVVAALGLRAGHSVGDPIPDEDIRRIVRTWVFEGADEAEVYRVREALRRTGGRMMSHS